MRDRIVKFITTENISSTKFADEIGVQRSSVSHILSGRNNPSFEFIQKILARYKQLNAEWLIMGTGNMLKTVRQASIFDELEKSPVTTASNTKVEAEVDIESKHIEQPEHPKMTSVSTAQKEVAFTSLGSDLLKEQKKIDKVILIYSDKTFSEYKPES